MPGFLGKVGGVKTDFFFSKNRNKKLINKKLLLNDFYIEQRTIDKFQQDKIFENNGQYFVLTEGVILNSHELIEKYQTESLFEAIITMYKKIGSDFFKEFRGSFSGVFFDKKRNKKIIYTSHIGDKQVFYSQIGSDLVFGSDINYIVDYYQTNNLQYTLNKKAAYYLLTFGFMLEDNTIFSQINKLIAGHYILIENGKLEIIQYYKLDNTPNYEQSEEEIIENIDRLFRQAIKRAFDKDLEYNYQHLVSLSAGLDSRMTTWVANDLGYGGNIVNFTFSQSDYLDETVPKKIASDLKHQWIFKALDNGLFLQELENVIKRSAGELYYWGLALVESFFDLIDKENFGINHTGQLGDVILGTYYSSLDKDKNYTLTDGANSVLLANKLEKNWIKFDYANEEIFKFYGRGFNGIVQGILLTQETMEYYSPFCDVDFLQYSLQIPLELRYHHAIYIKWILTKYPKAADYKWEKIKRKLSDKKIKVFLKRVSQRLTRYFRKILKIKYNPLNTKQHMNPLDYWYNTNKDLKIFLDQYFNSNINRLDFEEELKTDCIYLYQKGRCFEKAQVLTLLAVLKIYFANNDITDFFVDIYGGRKNHA